MIATRRLHGELTDDGGWPAAGRQQFEAAYDAVYESLLHDRFHPVTHHLPDTFTSPANEWYIWKPSPRLNKHVKVLLTLDPKNYPIGLKDTIIGGDLPVVWTNTRYRMIYTNMGHGDKIFASSQQNKLFEDAIQSRDSGAPPARSSYPWYPSQRAGRRFLPE